MIENTEMMVRKYGTVWKKSNISWIGISEGGEREKQYWGDNSWDFLKLTKHIEPKIQEIL